MEAHPASRRDPPTVTRVSPWAGLVVVAATAVVIAPLTVTASWTWHLSAVLALTALSVVASRASGPAPLRTMVYLDVAFLVFALGAHRR